LRVSNIPSEESVKRTLLLLVTVLFAMNAQAQAGQVWFKTVDAAQKEAKKKNQLIFVDLFAEWCGWCHRAEKDIFPSEPFKKVTNDMVLLRLDTEDRAEGTRFAQKLQITSLPTFLILTDDLMVAGIIRGYAEKDIFSAQVVKTRTAYTDFEKQLKIDYASNPTKQLEMLEQILGRHGYSRAETRAKSLIAAKNAPAAVRSKAYYHLAMAQLSQDNVEAALKTLDDLDRSKPEPELAETAAYLRAEIHLQRNELKPALAEFKRFKTHFPKSGRLQYVNIVIPQIESALKNAQ
jgi:thioredoxin-related protein